MENGYIEIYFDKVMEKIKFEKKIKLNNEIIFRYFTLAVKPSSLDTPLL